MAEPRGGTTALLYAATVLIWGASWIGVAFQIEAVEPVHAVLYRYIAAAALTFLWLAVAGRGPGMPARAHPVAAAMGVAIFGASYVMVYEAIGLGLSSGVAAVLFSLLAPINAANAALFLRERPGPGFALSASLGLAGIALLFLDDLRTLVAGESAPLALFLCLAAVYASSLGNLGSRRMAALGVDVLKANAWAMLYAAVALLAWALAFARPFTYSLAPEFLVSFGLLTVFSTVVAFWTYFTLVHRIGAAKAAYSFVAFPAVALAISSIWEGYEWTWPRLLGVLLVAAGNLTLLRGARSAPRPASP